MGSMVRTAALRDAAAVNSGVRSVDLPTSLSDGLPTHGGTPISPAAARLIGSPRTRERVIQSVWRRPRVWRSYGKRS